MTQQQAADANAQNRAERNQRNAERTGGIALEPVGGAGGYGGAGSGSSSVSAGGGYGAGTVTGVPGSVVSSPGVGGGSINLSRGSYETQQQMLLEDRLAREREQRALAALQGMGGSAAPGRVSYDTSGAEAARAAAFARAKEQAGQTAAAAMRTLQDVVSRRRIRGSTIEGGMLSDITQQGAGRVQDFTREQLIRDLENIQHIADTTYQGDIAQRGQDVSARQAMLSILSGLY
jgi:hypothetical protein